MAPFVYHYYYAVVFLLFGVWLYNTSLQCISHAGWKWMLFTLRLCFCAFGAGVMMICVVGSGGLRYREMRGLEAVGTDFEAEVTASRHHCGSWLFLF